MVNGFVVVVRTYAESYGFPSVASGWHRGGGWARRSCPVCSVDGSHAALYYCKQVHQPIVRVRSDVSLAHAAGYPVAGC